MEGERSLRRGDEECRQRGALLKEHRLGLKESEDIEKRRQVEGERKTVSG